MSGFLNEDRPVQTLRQVLTKLQDAYCSSIGYEVRPTSLFLIHCTSDLCKCTSTLDATNFWLQW